MIVGTAGHVNHGKTTLVKALTGVDCDRLDEEKRRGMTIRLGFAPWKLGDGRDVSLVDMPGHADFASTMASGALALDGVLLVVAADEGVCAQTREHLHVCDVLGVRRAIIALSRVDRVPDPELAADLVRRQLRGSAFEDQPIVHVCAPRGEGIDALTRLASEHFVRRMVGTDGQPPLLPIDRAFAIPGAGTVVTGSLIRGELDQHAQVVLAPHSDLLKIRALHIHGRATSHAIASTRLAVNLPGLQLQQVPRGAVLTVPSGVCVGRVFDAEVQWLSHVPSPLRALKSLGFVCGPVRAAASVRADAEIAPGSSGPARVELDRDVALAGGLRFVLRGSTLPGVGAVWGGGRILDAAPPSRRRRAVRQALCAAQDPLGVLLDEAGVRGVCTRQLGARLGIPPVSGDAHRYAPAVVEQARERLVGAVHDFHQHHPRELGVAESALTSRELDLRLVRELVESGRLIREGPLLRLQTFDVGSVAAHHDSLRQTLAEVIANAGLCGPSERDLLALEPCRDNGDGARRELRRLETSGRVVRCQGLYFDARALQHLAREAARAALAQRTLPVSWLKEHANVTRKHAIPLWTWLDRCGATSRRGNLRVGGPLAGQLARELDSRALAPAE